MTLRLAFMGSPDFAVPTLEAILAAGHEIACVYSQPPRPAGRGKELRKTAVHMTAERHGLTVRTPLNFKAAADRDAFAALQLDVAVVVAYGLLLPQAVLEAPRLGCFNLHGSILPRWRGAAPIHRAVMEGDTVTGVQVMKMEAGLDTGPVMKTATTPITEDDTTGDVQRRLASLGANLMIEATGPGRQARWRPVSAACRPFPARGSSFPIRKGASASRRCTQRPRQARASPAKCSTTGFSWRAGRAPSGSAGCRGPGRGR